MKHFDVVVIGGGSAGGRTAFTVRPHGVSVAVIEKAILGGECPHFACVPTKLMVRSAKIYSYLKRASEFGLKAQNIGFDWKKVADRRDGIISRIANEKRYEERFKKTGIEVFRGPARFKSEFTISVGGTEITARKFLIATGSSPAVPPIPGLKEAGYLTNISASRSMKLPNSIAIIGGGPVGVEFANIYSAFDVKTYLIQSGPQLVPREEPEIASILWEALGGHGVQILVNAEVTGVKKVGERKKVSIETAGEKREIAVEEILVAAGRQPDVEELELTVPGITLEPKGIPTNEHLQTNHPSFWAAGDVVGKMLFTHVAAYQGYVAAQNMVGKPMKEDLRVVPRVTFSDPEIASVGWTEKQAKEQGYEVTIRKHPYEFLSRAHIDSETRGLVKVVLDAKKNQILGGHIIGERAGELIHEIAVAMRNNIPWSNVGSTIHAFPTFSEAVGAAQIESLAQ